MKNLSVIGIGRLGLCWALVLEKSGYNVLGCDIIESYVKSLNEKTFISHEPHVNEYLRSSKNFTATTSIAETTAHADTIFINVRTDSDVDGKYNLSQVISVVDSLIDLGPQLEQKHLIVATNVNPGYSDEIAAILAPLNYVVSFSPEYVPQGKIIEWDERPEIVVIGETDTVAGDELQKIFETVCQNDAPIYRMDRLSAEISKLALNCYLTVKISYANSIGDLALRAGADPEKILAAVGADTRIGHKYLKYGFGYGGPCFPRDNKALIHYSNKVNASVPLNAAADQVNTEHLQFQISHFVENNTPDTIVIFNGTEDPAPSYANCVEFGSVAYKSGTVILEESQQLMFAAAIAKHGYRVVIADTDVVVSELKRLVGDLFSYE
tara:strand:+ start:494 stop:1636 length:1143 start_codon:yes stop_codon:yes gene_type:complete